MMNSEFRRYGLEISLFLLCFANLFFSLFPQTLLYLVCLVSACYRLSRPCLAFICLNWLKDVNHAFFFLNLHIPHMAPVTVVLGLMLISGFLVSQGRVLIKRGMNLWLVIIYLLITYFVAGNYIYSSDNVSTLLTTGILTYVSYAYIITYRRKCDFYLLALYSTIFALYLLQLNVVANHYGRPESILDFGFYRKNVGTDMYVGLGLADTGILYATHYQFFGTMISMCVTLLFATIQINKMKYSILFIFSIIVIGYTGARQYLGIFFVIFFIYLLFTKMNKSFKMLFFVGGVLLVLFIVNDTSLNEYFLVLEERGIYVGTGRDVLLYRGLEIFRSYPLLGVGFNGYDFMGNHNAYPHNMIVEMLADLGIVGSGIFFILVFMKCEGIKYLYNKKLKVVGFYIFLTFFLRSMVSLSFAQNIIIFSTLCALAFFRDKDFPNKKIQRNAI